MVYERIWRSARLALTMLSSRCRDGASLTLLASLSPSDSEHRQDDHRESGERVAIERGQDAVDDASVRQVVLIHQRSPTRYTKCGASIVATSIPCTVDKPVDRLGIFVVNFADFQRWLRDWLMCS